MIKPLLYINPGTKIKYIYCKQINPHINWFFHSKINFAKLSNLMPCINKLYLSRLVLLRCFLVRLICGTSFRISTLQMCGDSTLTANVIWGTGDVIKTDDRRVLTLACGYSCHENGTRNFSRIVLFCLNHIAIVNNIYTLFSWSINHNSEIINIIIQFKTKFGSELHFFH